MQAPATTVCENYMDENKINQNHILKPLMKIKWKICCFVINWLILPPNCFNYEMKIIWSCNHQLNLIVTHKFNF